MSVMASQITSLTIVYSNVYSSTDQRKHQISTSVAGNSPVTGEFPEQRASNAEESFLLMTSSWVGCEVRSHYNTTNRHLPRRIHYHVQLNSIYYIVSTISDPKAGTIMTKYLIIDRAISRSVEIVSVESLPGISVQWRRIGVGASPITGRSTVCST